MKSQVFLIFFFFSSICTPIQNTSILPPFLYRKNARTTSFYVTKNYILLKIKKLDLCKAHGWDNIPIKMIKICGDSITVLLKIIFEQFLKEKNSRIMEKSKYSSCTYKRRQKPNKNYLPVRLFPILSKSYERVIYNALFKRQ